MLARRAIYFADVFSLFKKFFMVDLGATSSQEVLDGSSPTFQRLVELCKGLINVAFIWQSIKGRCHGNHRQSENRRFLRKNFLCRAALSFTLYFSLYQTHRLQFPQSFAPGLNPVSYNHPTIHCHGNVPWGNGNWGPIIQISIIW